MVKSYKLHKFFGLTAGLVVLVLSITGFFLDHDKWDFLYNIKFSTYPSAISDANRRLFTSYIIDQDDQNHIFAGSKRGLFESFDGGKTFKKSLNKQVNAIKRAADGVFYFATSDGVYFQDNATPKAFLLTDKYINAISIYDDTLVAVEDKKTLYIVALGEKKIRETLWVSIPKSELYEDIKLSRFVRDLHYGRGLFDSDISLYINDYGAIVLTLLGLSGFLIWYYIHRKKAAKNSRKWIRYHANIFTIVALIPVFILSVTGIFLDHNDGLGKFMKSVTIPHAVLPPVYDSLQADIWSVDYDGKTLRIGNRYGVYKSSDFKNYTLESRGFGYSLSRSGSTLYVGGMGAANRVFDGKWSILRGAPHMFKTVFEKDGEIHFFSSHHTQMPLPTFQEITLYSILLTMHDGTFFSSWWIWINDYAAVALLLLFITGLIRWLKKKRLISFS